MKDALSISLASRAELLPLILTAAKLSRMHVILCRARVQREEMALMGIPSWRFIRRHRQASRLLDAKVALVAAESAARDAERKLAEARGAA